MFEWLQDEMDRIKTNKFHLVDGPLSPENRKLVEDSEISVPGSYKEFVIKFGNAKLYRSGIGYMVHVFSVPIEFETQEGEVLWHFGRTDRSLAYFKDVDPLPGAESVVYEWRYRQGIRSAANGFEDWLKSRCASARKHYRKAQWQWIVDGPPPFTSHEIRIREARRLFRWTIVGVSESGDIRFEVTNGSEMSLPFLSIGIRGKDGFLQGGAYLPVADILPGHTKTIEFDCYKKQISPDRVEAFGLPDPEPEDREVYWEFR